MAYSSVWDMLKSRSATPMSSMILRSAPRQVSFGLPSLSLRISISSHLEYLRPIPTAFRTASLAANLPASLLGSGLSSGRRSSHRRKEPPVPACGFPCLEHREQAFISAGVKTRFRKRSPQRLIAPSIRETRTRSMPICILPALNPSRSLVLLLCSIRNTSPNRPILTFPE